MRVDHQNKNNNNGYRNKYVWENTQENIKCLKMSQ